MKKVHIFQKKDINRLKQNVKNAGERKTEKATTFITIIIL